MDVKVENRQVNDNANIEHLLKKMFNEGWTLLFAVPIPRSNSFPSFKFCFTRPSGEVPLEGE